MFYTLQEVAERLGKNEAQVKELVKEGKLREFRDGAKLLFKADEVDTLLTQVPAASDESVVELAPSETAEVELKPSDTKLAPEESVLGQSDVGRDTEGISVLGASDSEYELTDDTLGKTREAKSDRGELGKIEEDVSLDSFGSGSGLLDLSLQADDTSLGADILDDIYPGEAANGAAAGEMMEKAAEADEMLVETSTGSLASVEAIPQEAIAPALVQPGYLEPRPDPTSNAFGFVLLLPLLAVVYTAIVAAAGSRGVAPAILTKVAGVPNLIWYVGIGAALAAGAIIGIAAMASKKGAKKPQNR